MRRPHVYERSVPRLRREAYSMPDGDPVQAARTILRALPALITRAQVAGLAELAEHLEAARTEAARLAGNDVQPEA